jgi:hypothetical protein
MNVFFVAVSGDQPVGFIVLLINPDDDTNFHFALFLPIRNRLQHLAEPGVAIETVAFRDCFAFFHSVVALDTTQKLY